MHYDGEDDELGRESKENYGTGVEQFKPSMEGNSYKSVIKQLQFIVNNNMGMKKKIQEMMK